MPKTPFQNSFHFMLHGSHHVAPMDHLRLVMPVVPCSFLRLVFCLFAWLTTSDCYSYQSQMVGVMLGYLSYDLTHYGCHHANYSWLKFIKRSHLRHHFHGPNEEPCNFALSYLSTPWDYIFGTR